jgi:integrase
MSETTRLRLKSVQPGFREGPPKNKHARWTILVPSVGALLGDPGAPDDKIFRMKSGTLIRWDNFRKRVWIPAVNKAHAKDPSFPASLRFHDLRHAFVSISYNEIGLNPRQIAEMSGHRDVAVMLNVYLHVFAGWDEGLADKFEATRQGATLRLIEGGSAGPGDRQAPRTTSVSENRRSVRR